MERRPLVLLLSCLALGLWSCGQAAESPDSPATQAAPLSPQPSSRPGVHPPTWQYLQTLHKHRPDGLYLEPVIELEEPTSGRVDIVAAVGRPAGPTLELWRFVAREPEGFLAPERDPALLLNIGAGIGEPAAELDSFRSRLAAPHNRVRRPLGLTDTDHALLPRVVALARTVRNTKSAAEARTRALAELLRGVDDTLVFEQNRLHEVIDLFASEPSAVLTDPGTRRSLATVGDREVSLIKKSGGWAVTELGPASPPPSAAATEHPI